MSEFSNNLKNLMKLRKISAAELGRKAKIPKSTISEWMQGRQPKFDETILRLAQVLGVSVEKLLTGSPNTKDEDLVEQILSQSDDGFVEIHSGVYRLKIEKFKGK
ncbi:MAG: helix-turn-helix transcriptional regulator [Bdellovibrionaceae bacterium]|nr:helix-turn-helix transcriptional regulator [Pseudobdellovibrionaceae bacterium]